MVVGRARARAADDHIIRANNQQPTPRWGACGVAVCIPYTRMCDVVPCAFVCGRVVPSLLAASGQESFVIYKLDNFIIETVAVVAKK